MNPFACYMKEFLLFAIAALFVSSCSTTQKVTYSREQLDHYVGYTHQQIVEELGAPTNRVEDGGDGYILVYDGSRDIFDYSDKYANKSATLPKAQFYMNSRDICTRVRADNTDSIKVISVGGTIALVLLILVII